MKHEPDIESRIAGIPGADFTGPFRESLRQSMREVQHPRPLLLRRAPLWQSAIAAVVVGAACAAAVYFAMSSRPVTQHNEPVVVSIRMESVWRVQPALDISNWSPR